MAAHDFDGVIRKLKRSHHDAEQSVTDLRNLTAAAAFERARILQHNDAEWERFIADGVPGRRNEMQRGDCLRHTLILAYGSTKKSNANRARDHARKLDELWRSDATAFDVYRQLDEHGFDKLARPSASAPAARLTGRKAIPTHFKALGMRKFDNLTPGQEAWVKVRKVKLGSKFVLRSEEMITDSELVNELTDHKARVRGLARCRKTR